MMYIENIFICIAVPMLLSLLFIPGEARKYTFFVTTGMGMCMLSAYVNSFFMNYAGLRRSDEIISASVLHSDF